MKAVLLGGAAGAFVGPDQLDLRLTHEDTRAAGVTLGSGVVIVYDDEAELVPRAAAHRGVLPRRVVRPVRAVPRRHGAPGGGAEAARRRTAARRTSCRRSREVAQVMRDASICGLGQTAANAVESAIANLGVFRMTTLLTRRRR